MIVSAKLPPFLGLPVLSVPHFWSRKQQARSLYLHVRTGATDTRREVIGLYGQPRGLREMESDLWTGPRLVIIALASIILAFAGCAPCASLKIDPTQQARGLEETEGTLLSRDAPESQQEPDRFTPQ